MSRPKGSKNKKRGRPKGSLNKHDIGLRRRGRPKKIVSIVHKIELPPIETRKYKWLGYCKKCQFIITKNELISKFIYLCPCCGNKNRISKLRKERKGEKEKPKNKKEYLDLVIHSNYSESIIPVDHGYENINPNSLKVQE